MKLEEKLIKLRKERAWSQEEFAEKLNVTRQTISKWELGQTRPDTDNLTKIATTFGISVNDLLDENSDTVTNNIEKNNYTNNSTNNNTKIVIIIIILVCVIAGIGIITFNKIIGNLSKAFNNVFNYAFSITDSNPVGEVFKEYVEISKDEFEESKDEFEDELNNKFNTLKKDEFNNKFKTLYYGSTDGYFMSNFIDKVRKSNEENKEHIIIVSYDGIETSNTDELKEMKKKFKTENDYDISYKYDDNGFICEAIIEEESKEESKLEKTITDTFENLMGQMENIGKEYNNKK